MVVYKRTSFRNGSNNPLAGESNGCRMRSLTGYCPKPLEAASGYLSKKWTISLIMTIGNFERLRFTEIERRVAGITPKTLAERLTELQNSGILQRSVFREIPPRVEYSLTPTGEELREALVPLLHWAEGRERN